MRAGGPIQPAMRSITRRTLTPLLALLLCAVAAPVASAEPPANDNFADATELGARGSIDFDLTDATSESGEPTPGQAAARTVWFTYTPSATGFASFSTCRPETDLAMTTPSIIAYSGDSFAGITEISTSSGGCLNGRVNASLGPFAVTADETYRIQLTIAVDSEITGGALAYDFNTAIPANDDFADAQAISGSLPQTIAADNGLATIEDDEVREEWGPRNSLWFSWTADSDGVLSVANCPVSPGPVTSDTRIDVYTAADPVELSTLDYNGGNNDGCPAPAGLLSHAYVSVAQGVTYFIRLSNYSRDFGSSYGLKLRWVGAPELALKPTVYPTGAARGVGEILYLMTGEWASYPGLDSTAYQWQRCDEEGEPSSCADIAGATDDQYVVTVDDIGHTLRARVTGTNATNSTTYFSWLTSPVQPAPENDDLSAAEDLGSVETVSAVYDNWFATLEPGESDLTEDPDVAASVWYRWTAPYSKTYRIATCSDDASELPMMIGVYSYTGGGAAGLIRQAENSGGCDDESGRALLYFSATSGNEYYIQAAGTSSAMGQFWLRLGTVDAPIFDVDPAFSGTEMEGGELSLQQGEWTSEIPSSSSVAWSVCDATGDNCEADATTGDSFDLAQAVVGRRIRATVTASNANGADTRSVLSGVIAADADGDGFADELDACPTEAGTSPPNNGCQLSAIVKLTAPVISGSTQVGQTLSATDGTWRVDHNQLPVTLAYAWYRCTGASEDACATISGETATTYVLTANDIGTLIRARVRVFNAEDQLIQFSDFTPPVSSGSSSGGGTGASPPSPVDPFPTPSLPGSFGKVRLGKKNTIVLSKLNLACGATATGPCTGTLRITTARTKVLRKLVKAMKLTFRISSAPGTKASTTFKVSRAVANAVRTAKALKAKVSLTFGAPGWPQKSATASATLTK